MYVAAVHVYVKPEAVDEFTERIRANHEGSLAEPGRLRFDVARSAEDPTEFILWEVYVDAEAAAFHTTTPHYLAFKEQMVAMSARDRHSDLYEGLYVDSPKLGS
jgi:autoinducer 2-degrading protein